MNEWNHWHDCDWLNLRMHNYKTTWNSLEYNTILRRELGTLNSFIEVIIKIHSYFNIFSSIWAEWIHYSVAKNGQSEWHLN